MWAGDSDESDDEASRSSEAGRDPLTVVDRKNDPRFKKTLLEQAQAHRSFILQEYWRSQNFQMTFAFVKLVDVEPSQVFIPFSSASHLQG